MPEMPEVEIIRRGLAAHVENRGIVNIDISLPRLIKWPSAEVFRALATGQRIAAVKRRGKYLLLELSSDDVLVVHLRMTGRLCYVKKGEARDAYARIVFQLDNGDELVYADTRTLGTLYMIHPDEFWRISGLSQMGPEPLSDEFTAEYLAEKLKKQRGKIKSFLLNQKYIGGLGNIYVDECLFLSGILPMRAGMDISKEETEKLHKAINEVIAAGIRDGGTTFRDYRNSDGGKGSHQDNLYVYGRKGEKCRKCGSEIQKTEIGGRGTHYCAMCQK